MPQRILVVDDEPTVREIVTRYLAQSGFDVTTAGSGPDALRVAAETEPDLIVLDLMLPGLSGEEVCRQIRRQSMVPIIMLTARAREPERLQGLELGADDYVVKPFSPRELVARVKAVLRRTATRTVGPDDPDAGNPTVAGSLVMNAATRTATYQGEPLTLAAKEFDLLHWLAAHPGRVFSREQLLEQVWGWDYAGDSGTVTVHIHRLRTKIEDDERHPRHLKTVWSVGYKYEA